MDTAAYATTIMTSQRSAFKGNCFTTNTATRTLTQNTKDALQEAFHTQGFWLLPIGFFVCGFHVAFIGLDLPSLSNSPT